MQCLRFVSAASVALCLVATSTARADPPLTPSTPTGLSYVVVTNDGSMYAGDLVESVVRSHVTIRLATGEVRRFEASQVQRQGPTGQVAPPSPAAPPSMAGAGMGPTQVVGGVPGGPPIEYTGPGAIHVHIEGDGQIQHESANGWETVCSVPCATTVDPEGSYKLGGSDYADSRTFKFPSGPSTLELVAKPVPAPGPGRSLLGWSLAPPGAGLMVLGSLYLAGKIGGVNTATRIAGGTALGVGAVLLAVGIYVLVDKPRSRLETVTGERIAKQPALQLPAHATLTPSGLLF